MCGYFYVNITFSSLVTYIDIINRYQTKKNGKETLGTHDLSIEVMEFVAMFNKLLFPVLAWIDWGLEIPNFRCLECRTKWAECCIHIICLFPYRTIVDTTDVLN
jgi:hypothetical protein